ncbi:uncharacterized protein CDAR_453401 [Caerostris darwini]|uniref:Mutator-like transposase domain-containing protein n=1 Tax=Caerostris darwini TaxID=1538125 RepID=A0AAV4Q932_9ARAC|nr:uncharacterized protein CDAR_453401 [Caerostris darwini]
MKQDNVGSYMYVGSLCMVALLRFHFRLTQVKFWIKSGHLIDPLVENLKKSHKTLNVQHSNFKGSVSKMEDAGVSCIFPMSIKEQQLQSTDYYGDGDSNAYVNVKDIYDKNNVEKKECIGLVHKYAGSCLRKLESRTQGFCSKEKLADFSLKTSNYCAISIPSNIGNLKFMHQNIIAVLFHCVLSSEKLMHGQCSVEINSWCYFQRFLTCKSSQKKKYTSLPNDILNVI